MVYFGLPFVWCRCVCLVMLLKDQNVLIVREHMCTGPQLREGADQKVEGKIMGVAEGEQREGVVTLEGQPYISRAVLDFPPAACLLIQNIADQRLDRSVFPLERILSVNLYRQIAHQYL